MVVLTSCFKKVVSNQATITWMTKILHIYLLGDVGDGGDVLDANTVENKGKCVKTTT